MVISMVLIEESSLAYSKDYNLAAMKAILMGKTVVEQMVLIVAVQSVDLKVVSMADFSVALKVGN